MLHIDGGTGETLSPEAEAIVDTIIATQHYMTVDSATVLEYMAGFPRAYQILQAVRVYWLRQYGAHGYSPANMELCLAAMVINERLGAYWSYDPAHDDVAEDELSEAS